MKIVLIVCYMVIVFGQDLFVSNLNNECLECLCYASTRCNLRSGCNGGYCGAYQIGYHYWKDAGSPTLPGNLPYFAGAFESCALTLSCARNTIKQYISKHGKDCNEDGITNCDEYAMINFNGASNCNQPLSSFSGREFWRRYIDCKTAQM
ncbi:lysozyme-like [Photinus pyralis]|uniref:lysozyme-like n=1 Tax=Photinus pyralis TaxID=7054 RepID=UPI0012676665|nr:lysozyme-like [Photinus pyralis]